MKKLMSDGLKGWAGSYIAIFIFFVINNAADEFWGDFTFVSSIVGGILPGVLAGRILKFKYAAFFGGALVGGTIFLLLLLPS